MEDLNTNTDLTVTPALYSDTVVETPAVHTVQTSFFSQNKMYIVAGMVGIVVITIATGVILSMGSSSRLQGMLDKRMIEQQAVTNSLPQTLKETSTLTVPAEVPATTPKGPSIAPAKQQLT